MVALYLKKIKESLKNQTEVGLDFQNSKTNKLACEETLENGDHLTETKFIQKSNLDQPFLSLYREK